MSGIIAWVMDRCMNSLSLNQYTMQRTDMGSVKNILKNGLRNRTTSVLRSLFESVSKIYLGYAVTNFVLVIHNCCVNSRAHWQMIVLCPTNNVVVWFCSLRKKPDVHIKTAINKLSNIF